MEQTKSWRENLGIVLILVGSLVFLIYLITLFSNGYLNISESLNPSISGQVGSFIGGVAGSMWALGGILFLYETLYFQRKEFKLTRENFIRNQKETTFFNLINQLNELINFISGEVTLKNNRTYNYEGRAYLHNVFQNFKRIHKKEISNSSMIIANIKAMQEVEQDGGSKEVKPQNVSLPELKETIVQSYETFYEVYHNNLGHYFRLIYNIVKFVVSNFESDEDRYKYLGILQAQLSNDELGLIFFNCLSKYSKNSDGEYQFHEWIDSYDLLENIDEKSIIFPVYSKYYPKTTFKFEVIN